MQESRISCQDLWQDALKQSKQILEEDDFEYIQNFGSADRLLSEVASLEREYSSRAVPRLLKSLRPQLTHLQAFVGIIVYSIGPESISSAYVWGTTFLLLNLASRSDEELQEVTYYLNDVGSKLALFEIYNKTIELDSDLLETFFGLLVALVLDCAGAIKHFRKSDIGIALNSHTWSNVQRNFSKTLRDLSGKIDHLHKLVKARHLTSLTKTQAELIGSLTNLNMDIKGKIQLPYFQYPFQRNTSFFGRAEILAELSTALSPKGSESEIVSAAIWGTGGIGKSQIALEYANRQHQLGYEFIMWIASETESEVTQSFVDAAQRTKPPGFNNSSTPEQAHHCMLNWLQTTSTPWLLVFDNLEDTNLLHRNWPRAGSGQIIITCRSEIVATIAAAETIEVPTFTAEEGGQLLLKLSGKEKKADENEILKAREMSDMLGGLALAIEIIARRILVRKCTIAEFIPYFVKNRKSLRKLPTQLRNPYYSKNLETVWQTAFQDLNPNSSQLLGILCFLAPDGIPRDLLHREVPALPWLHDDESYEDAQGELLFLSLIKIQDNMLSVHRLTAEAFYDLMTDSQRQESFEIACSLLCDMFPKRELGQHLYPRWLECERLIHHVVALQEKYEGIRGPSYTFQDVAYTRLMIDSTWFLAESGSFNTGHLLGSRAANNCLDKKSLICAHVYDALGRIDHRRGRYGDSYTYFKLTLDIRDDIPETPGNQMADANSCLCMALTGLYRNEEAVKYATKAIEYFHEAPEANKNGFHMDRYLRNRSRAHEELGQIREAKKDIEEAEAWQTHLHGPESHFHGESAYILGIIAEHEKKFDMAMDYYQRAYDLMSPGKPTHQSVAACLYHQALVHIIKPGSGEEDMKKALQLLEHCLQICQLNEPKRGDQGESARVKWRMAQVFERMGNVKDADAHRTAAKMTKAELEATGLFPTNENDEKSWDCFLDLIYR